VKVALAPLRERNFRLMFLGRVTSYGGSTFAIVAIPFAVLDLTGSVSDVGFVAAARSLPQVILLLVGGIWADRLPRHTVMVASNAVSASAQAATAALLLSGSARIWQLIALQAIGGAATAFFFPASTGLVPQTVRPDLLQEANALLRLALNLSQIGGAAAAGFLVAATGPGWAIAVDAGSFALGATFLAVMQLPRGERLEAQNFIHDLALGWREFRSRTWLWVIVAGFAFINAIEVGGLNVVGPVVAKRSLDGAASWGLIITAQSIGLIAAGFLMLRWRPTRILLVGTLGVAATAPLFALLAIPASVGAIAASGFIAGVGVEVFGVLWDMAMQQQIPQDRLSRVSSYDALGSFVAIPIGAAAAGPIAAAVGVGTTLWSCASVILLCTFAMLLARDVRTLRRLDLPARSDAREPLAVGAYREDA
jgi:predicted MFS family arabinose efflux permease